MKMPLKEGETPVLDPTTEVRRGSVNKKEKGYLEEIVQKVNDLFDRDLTYQDKMVYVNNVIKGKLMESEVLRNQAENNPKERFANSPDLNSELARSLRPWTCTL